MGKTRNPEKVSQKFNVDNLLITLSKYTDNANREHITLQGMASFWLKIEVERISPHIKNAKLTNYM